MPNFFFQRYVNGERMADDVLITKQQTLEAAIPEALRLCRNSPKSVLVHIAEDSLLREEVERLKSEESCNDVLLEYAQAETQRLREENAQLQAQREKDKRLNHETESGLLEENVRLREENAGLRKAVKAAYYEGWQDNASIDDTEDRLHAEWACSEACAAIQEGGEGD